MTITISKDAEHFTMKCKDKRFAIISGHKNGLRAPINSLFNYMDVITYEVNNTYKEECLFEVEE